MHAHAEHGADADQGNAVMRATRVLVAVTAQSVAELDERVTLPQLRILVVVAIRGPQNLTAVAQSLSPRRPGTGRRYEQSPAGADRRHSRGHV